jgi:hypothetical protein
LRMFHNTRQTTKRLGEDPSSHFSIHRPPPMQPQPFAIILSYDLRPNFVDWICFEIRQESGDVCASIRCQWPPSGLAGCSFRFIFTILSPFASRPDSPFDL